jgi:hypothetical protein
MPLDVSHLSDALKDVFADGMQATSSDQVAEALAKAIHDYVIEATVAGVVVDVRDTNGTSIGTGTQTGSVTVT